MQPQVLLKEWERRSTLHKQSSAVQHAQHST
jgi:hypothetical protein